AGSSRCTPSGTRTPGSCATASEFNVRCGNPQRRPIGQPRASARPIECRHRRASCSSLVEQRRSLVSESGRAPASRVVPTVVTGRVYPGVLGDLRIGEGTWEPRTASAPWMCAPSSACSSAADPTCTVSSRSSKALSFATAPFSVLTPFLRSSGRFDSLHAMQAPSRGDPLRTLVLNAGYEPLAVVSFKRALVLVLTEKAVVVASDDDNPVHGIGSDWERPSVILLRRYVRVPSGRSVPVSRRGVLRRDDQRCAYCGVHASTIDHVIPRSRGGADSWENLVACCLRCNN